MERHGWRVVPHPSCSRPGHFEPIIEQKLFENLVCNMDVSGPIKSLSLPVRLENMPVIVLQVVKHKIPEIRKYFELLQFQTRTVAYDTLSQTVQQQLSRSVWPRHIKHRQPRCYGGTINLSRSIARSATPPINICFAFQSAVDTDASLLAIQPATQNTSQNV